MDFDNDNTSPIILFPLQMPNKSIEEMTRSEFLLYTRLEEAHFYNWVYFGRYLLTEKDFRRTRSANRMLAAHGWPLIDTRNFPAQPKLVEKSTDITE